MLSKNKQIKRMKIYSLEFSKRFHCAAYSFYFVNVINTIITTNELSKRRTNKHSIPSKSFIILDWDAQKQYKVEHHDNDVMCMKMNVNSSSVFLPSFIFLSLFLVFSWILLVFSSIIILCFDLYIISYTLNLKFFHCKRIPGFLWQRKAQERKDSDIT